MKYAIVVMLPERPDDPVMVDFASREFDSLDEIAQLLKDVDAHEPKWRLVSFCHVEDLPLLMESPT